LGNDFLLAQRIEFTKLFTGVERMKTIREIAEAIGIDKQRVYRYIKSHGIAPHQKNGVMYFDDTAEMQIKQYFSAGHTSSEAHHETSPILSNDTVISIL
jgi:predicted transcriptional regulator